MTSPFRYPGGKSWLVPHVLGWLANLPRPKVFVEPFAGGASCGLAVLEAGAADHLLLVEKDRNVAAVWQAILSPDWEALCARIMAFNPTPENVQAAVNDQNVAFRTLVRNRFSFSGIMHGSGYSKEHRWYPQTLVQRISILAAARKHITIYATDGLTVMRGLAHQPRHVFFIDPPYPTAGKRLYAEHTIDRPELYQATKAGGWPFMLTDEDCPENVALAQRHHFVERSYRPGEMAFYREGFV